jgi:hypothetical protein
MMRASTEAAHQAASTGDAAPPRSFRLIDLPRREDPP